MADARSTTELRIKVDARDVRRLGKQLKGALDTRVTRSYRQSLGAVNKQLKENVRETQRIVTEMGRVQQGTRAYDQLKTKLKEANREASLLSATLSRLGGSGGARGFGASGGGGGRGGGFGGGRGGGIPSSGNQAINTALLSVPILGDLAAGAYQAAAGTYGSFASFQQAQMAASPFLTRSRAAARYRLPNAAIGANGQRTDASLMAEWMGEARTGPLGALAAGGEQIIGGLQRATGTTDSAGRTLGEARAYRDLTKRYGALGAPVGQQSALAFDPTALANVGGAFGLRPQQALQMAAQLSQAKHGPAGAADLEQALAAKQLFGTDVGTVGNLRGTMKRTSFGGKGGGRDDFTASLATAVRLGMEASEINEYLHEQTAFLKSIEAQGGKANMAEMLAVQEGLSAGGISKWRVGAMAQGFAGAANNVGRRGMQSGTDVRLLRAMGYTGKGGAEELARYRLMAQDPGMASRALPGYMQGFIDDYGLDPNSNLAALVMQSAAGRMGMQIGPGEARSMASNGSRIRGGINSALTTNGTNFAALTQSLSTAGRQMASGTGGTLIEQASIEQQRIAVGRKVAGAMLDLERSTVQIAGSFTNTLGPSLEATTFALDSFTAGLDAATAGMWLTSGNVSIRR